MKFKYLSVVFLFSFSAPLLCDTENNINFDISYNQDSNLNFSPIPQRRLDDHFYTMAVGINHNRRLDAKSFMDYHLLLRHEIYDNFRPLDNSDATLGLSYHIKPQGGFTRATYIFKTQMGMSDYATELRDQTHYNLSAMMSFWVTNTLSMRSGISLNKHDSDSRVYDTHNMSWFISTDILLNQNATFYSQLNLISGDVTSSLALTGYYDQILDIIRQAEKIESDDSFGEDIIAYRLDSRIFVLTLGYNHTIGHRQSIDISTRYAYAQADYDVDYEALFFNISYLASFRL